MVTRMHASRAGADARRPPRVVRRKCAWEKGAGGVERPAWRRPELQRSAIHAAAVEAVPPIVHQVLSSPGRPLDPEASGFMEPRFGHDFQRVRVHTDGRATASAQAVGARAYTVGNDIVFGAGQYAPTTKQGRRLLAHELTHVVQQSGNTSPPRSAISIGPTRSPQEHEADRMASRVVSAGDGHLGPAVSVNSTSSPTLQRQSGFDRFKSHFLDEYRIDIMVIPPAQLPLVGNPRAGVRRNPDGTWTLIVGNERNTVGADEIDDILSGLGRPTPRGEGSSPEPIISGLPTSPADPVFDCPPGQYFDFIALRCRPELVPEMPRLELTLPELRLPRPRLTLAGVEEATIDRFALDSAAIPGHADAQLGRLVALLNAHPDAVVHIVGHTDLSGSDEHNESLSQLRAEAVQQELVRRGVVNAHRFRLRGDGRTRPLNPEERTAAERAQNRRVEVWFTPSAAAGAEESRLQLRRPRSP